MNSPLTERAGPILAGDTASAESSQSAVSWSAIICGAVVAAAVSLLLVALGSGLGLASVSPWAGSGASATTFTVMTAIWFIVVQWVASGVGGYLTGRLRTKWVNVHTHEVFFRDTAHGFVTWALATVITALFLTSAASSLLGVELHTAHTVSADVTDAARKAAATAALFTALSMLIGAFIACAAAALGGHERDAHPVAMG